MKATLDAEMIAWASAAVMVVLFAVTLIVSLFDARLLGGVGVWAKPLKFQASTALHLATLALVVGALGSDWATGRLVQVTIIACVIACFGEVAYISLQAARGELSHFNQSTPFYTRMYSLMAVGAVVLTVAAGIIGVVAWLDPGARLQTPTRLAILLGLVGGTVLTLITAFTIGGRLSPYVGLHPPGGARMPVTGWSLATGDLRVSHFLATHMIQTIPAAGLLATRLVAPALAIGLVLLAALAWTIATLWTYRQALSGLPLWRG